ncbi:MAG: type II toxin-antitoxin system PemK/MazF family toxin [Cytophagales bacterium]|nr:type II toxin-antitoxin system PemK/MazF family toxin [Cytophagales bacterium]
MSTNKKNIRRGEIWLVDFNPGKGFEIIKKRPALVISSDSIGVLPIKLVSPITQWQNSFTNKSWLVKIIPDNQNNLDKASAIDALQLRGVDKSRFISKIGKIAVSKLKEVTSAVALVIEYY